MMKLRQFLRTEEGSEFILWFIEWAAKEDESEAAWKQVEAKLGQLGFNCDCPVCAKRAGRFNYSLDRLADLLAVELGSPEKFLVQMSAHLLTDPDRFMDRIFELASTFYYYGVKDHYHELVRYNPDAGGGKTMSAEDLRALFDESESEFGSGDEVE